MVCKERIVKLLKGNQVNVASNVARKIEDLRMQIRGLEVVLRNAGLHEDAASISNLGQAMLDASSRLENKARSTFLAARNGVELPSD